MLKVIVGCGGDSVVCYGGEEFVVIVFGSLLLGVLVLVEWLCEVVEVLLLLEGLVSISVGVGYLYLLVLVSVD